MGEVCHLLVAAVSFRVGVKAVPLIRVVSTSDGLFHHRRVLQQKKKHKKNHLVAVAGLE